MIYDLIPPDDPRLHTEIKKCSYDLDRKSLANPCRKYDAL